MIIRVASESDAPAIADVYSPLVTTTAISFETEPPGPAEIARRIQSIIPRHPWLVATQENALLGYAYASLHRTRPAYRWAVDVSAYVHPDHQRRGVGRALYSTLVGVLEAQGYRSAHAGIALPNPSSVAFHESLRFEPVGVYRAVGWKLGRWHDVWWWQKSLGTGTGTPSEPMPLDELRAGLLDSLLSGRGRVRNASTLPVPDGSPTH